MQKLFWRISPTHSLLLSEKLCKICSTSFVFSNMDLDRIVRDAIEKEIEKLDYLM